MKDIRVITDVPLEKLEQLVKDLGYEVGKQNIRPILQPNGFWKVEYSVGEPMPSLSGSYSPSSGLYSP